jgi:Cu+-exporting ATPase
MLVDEKFINLIASAEVQSEHPISQAIVKWAKQNSFDTTLKVDGLEIKAGLGISATCKEQKILVGNSALLEQNSVHVDQKIQEKFETVLAEGNGAVLASVEDICVGIIALEDSLKGGALEMVNELKRKDITPILLTGDNEITAKKIASQVGIELVYAEVLPDEKYKVIKDLQKNAKVMFVGDGINDSVSIKQADIGVALNSGSDITKDAGDIILMNNTLNSVTKSIRLSEKSMSTIKQNLFWAFFYNAIGIPIAAGVLYPIMGVMLTPMYAGMAMSFSSVTVVLNSLRLKFAKL